MRILSVTLLAVITAFSLTAQSQMATLTGTVTDPSGATTPAAQVRVVNLETGERYTATANAGGNYTIPLIKPGQYEVNCELKGFRQTRETGLTLETGQQARLDIHLEIGAVTESTTVAAEAPLLNVESSSVGAVVENRTIVSMPLIDRRAAQLVRLNGFVVQQGNGSNFSIAGGKGNNQTWLIDGGNAQNVTLGTPTLSFDPPVEALQEFNVAISNFAAELGRSGGGVIQMTTKSGTNQFHGSAYEYLRNDKLDARNFFSANKPPLRYNLFGTSVGGPIRKNKTHFFFNYEGLRRNNGGTVIQGVPTTAETRGDFSANPTVIRDPAAAGRPTFAGNIIPQSRLDPVGLKIASFFPAPNVPNRASGDANFRTNTSQLNPSNSYVARIDHVFSDTDRMYARALIGNSSTLDQPVWPTKGVDPIERFQYNNYRNISGTWFHSLSPTTINEFRFTYDRRSFHNLTGGAHTGLNGQIGLSGVDPDYFPRITLTGYTGFTVNANMERLQGPIRNNQYINNVTHIVGNHRMKFGGEFRYASNDDLNHASPGGLFGFNSVATGNAAASLLLGWAQSGSTNDELLIRSRANAYAAFAQDDWRVGKNLTLNLGLRWDADQPRWEQLDNRQNSFNRAAINPVCNCPGVVTFSGRNGVSKYASNWDLNNFGPRVGFAWRLGDKWVVRGGAGLLYTGEYDSATPVNAALGFSLASSFVSPDNGLTPAFLLRNGPPVVKLPTAADLTPGFGAVPVGQSSTNSVEFFEPGNRRNGYLEQINVNVQRQITANFLIEAGYLGTLGHKLPVTGNVTINQVPSALMGPGNAQNRRPFPQFSDVQVVAAAFGNSNYHGLNLRAEKRYSSGLHFQVNYTYSKAIDDVASRNQLGAAAGGADFQNIYDRKADRGLSGNDVKHRFIWSSVYELPVGKGRAFQFQHSLWNQILGGWSSGLIAEFRTGPPWGVVENVNTANAFSPSQRPNVVGNPAIDGSRSKAQELARWFNTAAFAAPAPFTFGNAGRSDGYGPGAINIDVSLIKEFRFFERHRLEFRCEILNSINHANFDLPNQQRGSPTFGQITSLIAGNQNRIIQLGLHYKF